MAKQMNVDFNLDPKVVTMLVIGLVIALLANLSVYKIDATERGVVLRFGKLRDALLEPGLNFVIPFVDKVRKVETEIIHKAEFGYRSTDNRADRTQYRKGLLSESLMVTGDLNMAEVEWSVQYRIIDPAKYLYKVRDPEGTLRDLSNSVMSQVLGDRSVYEALTVGRAEIEVEATRQLQEALNEYETGLRLIALKLQNVLPPDKVKPSYNAVNEAEQYRERLINEAQKERNSKVPKARGEAKQRLEQAQGYRVDRINRAKGDANRFIAIYEAYKQAKDVTRKRLYLETMNEILGSVDQIILVDEEQQSVLPLLNLGKEGNLAKP